MTTDTQPGTVERDGSASLKSLVFRLQREKKGAVEALARETRIPYSVLMREAISDMLRKRNSMPDGAP